MQPSAELKTSLAGMEERGRSLLKIAMDKGHVYAAEYLGDISRDEGEFGDARNHYSVAAALGLPSSLFKYALSLETGEGGLELDEPKAVELYRKAAANKHAGAAANLRFMRAAGRGVTRSKRSEMICLRKTAENGSAAACFSLARAMFIDQPYAREVGKIEHTTQCEATEDGLLASLREDGDSTGLGADSVTFGGFLEWLSLGALCGGGDVRAAYAKMRVAARDGDRYCCNTGCEFVAPRMDFKMCGGCKLLRYCGPVCQKIDWTQGEHKHECGTYKANARCRLY